MTTSTKTSGVKQKCFNVLNSHSDFCTLFVYGKDVNVLRGDHAIFSYLRDVSFGSLFSLVYFDSRDVRHAIHVLVDERKWHQISEYMFSLLYDYKKRLS